MPETKGRTLEGLDQVFNQGTWEFAKKALDEGKQSLRHRRNTAEQAIDGVALGPLSRNTDVQNPGETANGNINSHN